jgi:anti-sigma factor RsiW
MTGPTTTCSESQIEALLAGALDDQVRNAIEAHLDTCVACRERIDALAATPDQWSEVRTRLASAEDTESAETEAATHWTDPRAVLRLLAPTDDPEMLGRMGPYEIQGIIGSGGMGVVLKGWDRSLRRFVAIKLMAPHLAASAPARRRFLRESRAAAAVVHENVVAIHGVAEADGLPYLVMPYSRGESLQKRLGRVGPLAVEEILRIALQTARGLAAAHAQGLVHRDVKPANILLDEGVERVLLMDFGLARAVDDASLTRSGVIAGTPQYMSPEQVLARHVDPRADLFALGSTMYAMCTGHAPFRAESTYAILRQITDVEPQPISEANPEIPEWLSLIVARLMAKNLEDRFASAKELAELLEACLANLERSPEMPLSESAFESFGIFAVAHDDLDDDVEAWPGESFDTLTGAYAGRIREFARSRGGIAVGILTLLTLTVAGFVIGTEPPEIAGTWQGEDWGTVKLEAKAPGTLEGTFDDTVNGQPGKLKLQWSRVERRYVGEWHEGEDRFGKMSIRLDGDAIRGAMTTDPASKVNPGTPQLADLAWFRGSPTRSFGMAAGDYRVPARAASADIGLAVDPLRFIKKDLVPFQGKWEVVEERISGMGRNSPLDTDRPRLKALVFRDVSLMIEHEKDGEPEVTVCPKIGHDFDVIIMKTLPDEVLEGQLLILEGQLLILKDLPQTEIPLKADFRIEKDYLELKFEAEAKPNRSVRHEYRLKLDSKAGRAPGIDPNAVAGIERKSSSASGSNKNRANRTEQPGSYGAFGGKSVEIAKFVEIDAAEIPEEVGSAKDIAIVKGEKQVGVDVVIAGQPIERNIAGSSETKSDVAVTIGAAKESNAVIISAQPKTLSKKKDDSMGSFTAKPDVAQADSFGGIITEVRKRKAGVTSSTFSADLGQFEVAKSFPEDYSVVHSQEIRPGKLALSVTAKWSEVNSETIRKFGVSLSEANSTALVKLPLSREVTWSAGESEGTIGDPKATKGFSLIQFELLSDKVVRVKCWVEKSRKNSVPINTTSAKTGRETRTSNGQFQFSVGSDFEAGSSMTIESSAAAKPTASATSASSKKDDSKSASTAATITIPIQAEVEKKP